ncbi:protein odr-4 homolog isoform X3 [Bubalus kerabau]|uniref:protein odr-4 homolog isoform X3 n=1 Tax=Bubalus carabanensis TaxID=3119969 RepID=UPI00244EB71A|nr:protein odr-4 homolog isoform X3 [Bubalus carabanensis]
MGRTYIVEETVGQYLSNVNLQGKAFVSGLLIGQCSSQKDYVILATRTPPKEKQNESPTYSKAKLDNLDEEWATEHAHQVSRMLPGGLLVLGVFIITALEMGSEFQNTLRRLVFAVEKSVNKKRLWNFTEEEVSERVILHFCSSTKKIFCRTYDIHDPKSSAKPADWKYQNGLSASWLSLECTVYINIHVPLSTTSISYTLEKNTKNGLARWAKQIENGIYLINGQVKDEDCDLLEGQKKSSRGNTQAANHSFDIRVLTQLAMKRDILNTVADRCEILFEDLLLNEIPEKKVMSIKLNSEKEFHILPHRVFVPIPGSTVMLCDYKFGDESAEEIRDHFLEMLDRMIQIEDLEIAEEINTACISSSMDTEASLNNTDDEQPKQPIKTTIVLKIQQNIGVIAAFAVAALAAGISFHCFSD